MAEDCTLGAENKTRINGLCTQIKEIKDVLKGKVSALFVGVGIFVLACILGFIYQGQSAISKDITDIKIEQGKVTNKYELNEKRIDRLDAEMFEIRRKIGK